jgi:glycosyltransferase involved in cell wall biosynthesis
MPLASGWQKSAPARPLEQPRVSVVIPVLNEARNLEAVLPTLRADYELIVVDGGSIDDSVAVASRLRPDAVIVQQTRRGKGNALACGFERVTGDIVVMFDADGSADAEEIDRFVDTLLAGADFAKGSRFRTGGGSADITRIRSTGNLVLNWHANRLFRTRFTDLCYGYNAFWADVIDVISLPGSELPAPLDGSMRWGDGFEVETLINCRVAAAGLRTVEVPSFEHHRIHGVSNLNAVSDGMRVLRTMWAEKRRAMRGIAAADQVVRNDGDIADWDDVRPGRHAASVGSDAPEARIPQQRSPESAAQAVS